MKAMILAAGLGKRMSPLTDHTPKPMLRAGGKPLIQYQVERLRAAGIKDMLINLAYLGEQISQYFGSGEAFGVSITYSREPFPLETGGAIAMALDYLGADPFVLVNADVWSDFDYLALLETPLGTNDLARLVMVPNPGFHSAGDFSLAENGALLLAGARPSGADADSEEYPAGKTYTYSGMALISPALIANYPNKRKKFALREVFDMAINQGKIKGEVHSGEWRDIGSPERLYELDECLLR